MKCVPIFNLNKRWFSISFQNYITLEYTYSALDYFASHGSLFSKPCYLIWTRYSVSSSQCSGCIIQVVAISGKALSYHYSIKMREKNKLHLWSGLFKRWFMLTFKLFFFLSLFFSFFFFFSSVFRITECERHLHKTYTTFQIVDRRRMVPH